MRYSQLTEAVADDIAVFYGGRFQPMHQGHSDVYKHLCSKFVKIQYKQRLKDGGE